MPKYPHYSAKSLFLKEKLAWNYLVAFAFLGVAAFFAFAFKAPGSVI